MEQVFKRGFLGTTIAAVLLVGYVELNLDC